MHYVMWLLLVLFVLLFVIGFYLAGRAFFVTKKHPAELWNHHPLVKGTIGVVLIYLASLVVLFIYAKLPSGGNGKALPEELPELSFCNYGRTTETAS